VFKLVSQDCVVRHELWERALGFGGPKSGDSDLSEPVSDF
jgi:hypothetical protein